MKSFRYIALVFVAGLLILLVLPAAINAQNVEKEQLAKMAREAGIEQTLLDELSSRAEKHGASDESVATIIRSATEMAQNNLPYDVIFNKAFEGLTKGVPANRVEAAILNMKQRIGEAAEVVDPWLQNDPDLPFKPQENPSFRNGLVVAVSNVMNNNVSADAAGDMLRSLSEASLPAEVGPAEIIAAVRIVPDMTAFTGQPESTTRFVLRLVKGGFNAAEMLKLPTAMRYYQGRNQLPASAMIETVSGQLQGLPAARIIQNLMTNSAIQNGSQGRNKIAI